MCMVSFFGGKKQGTLLKGAEEGRAAAAARRARVPRAVRHEGGEAVLDERDRPRVLGQARQRPRLRAQVRAAHADRRVRPHQRSCSSAAATGTSAPSTRAPSTSAPSTRGPAATTRGSAPRAAQETTSTPTTTATATTTGTGSVVPEVVHGDCRDRGGSTTATTAHAQAAPAAAHRAQLPCCLRCVLCAAPAPAARWTRQRLRPTAATSSPTAPASLCEQHKLRTL